MTIYKGNLLIVDSEICVQKEIIAHLSLQNYKVISASNGKDALVSFITNKPDLVILDVLLTKLDGYSVCRKIRENSKVPIILVSPSTNISDCIFAFQVGADDYMIKPFFQKELEVRIKALLNRTNKKLQKLPKRKILQIHSLILDPNKRFVLQNNSEIKLTELEYLILKLFIENSGKELSRTMILNNVWGYVPDRYVDTRIVDVHISRLRSKIEKNPRNPDLILTARGVGYIFTKH